jgi:sugar phosphate isomerase/epimerase
MEVFFHTIALEPARWTPRKVSRNVVDLLPKIAESGFRKVEIFEPHLRELSQRPAIKAKLEECALEPVILSSYIDLAGLSESDLPAAVDALEETLRDFAFPKVRIFPGPRVSPSDEAAIATFTSRLAGLVRRLPGTEILLETHDLSIADDPDRIVKLVEALGAPNVGLLFQPTIFDGKTEVEQFARQRGLIRHVHLQNRKPDRSFETLEKGVTPWAEIFRDLPAGVNASLEFVPSGICPEDQFDLDAVLAQACQERDFVQSIS